ncbi:MAG: diguanylate cyclase [Terracidiphilus sp.]|jgi:diguanylate cyclase (GGDEF)-like protein
MKRLILIFAGLFGCLPAALAASTAQFTTVRAIHEHADADAQLHLPVAVEATVTYFQESTRYLFVQDDGAAIYIYLTKDVNVAPGDRVLVRGTVEPSFHPVIKSEDVTVLRHGELPKSLPANYDDLIHARYDSLLVTTHAIVRSADLIVKNNAQSIFMHTLVDQGSVDVAVESTDGSRLKDLLDAEVEITGVAAGKFDTKMQPTGVELFVPSMASIKVLKNSDATLWRLPVTPMDRIVSDYRILDLTSRVHVHGTITYYRPGKSVVLQDGKKSLWISTGTSDPMRVGDIVEAYGFPDVQDGFLNLVQGVIVDSGIYAPITPHPESWDELSRSDNIHFGHIYDLVSIEGRVVTEAREAERDEYVLNLNGRLYTAMYYHSDASSHVPLPDMKMVPIGATVRVSGICGQLSSNPWNGTVPFDILLRSFDDIVVIGNPSPLNVRNLTILVGLLFAVVLIAGARGWALERKVHRQAAATADLERRRSRLLEDINGSRPLAEIIEEITELISFMANGAPCWCQIADGARLGNYPRDLSALRIAQQEIPARCGSSLGKIFIGLDPLAPSPAAESEALSMGVGLAALAIESRRLYSELLRRSEFDLLTDIHNRFSLEQLLDTQIEEARQEAGIFGLVYIDLDKFKQINDLYGHHIGDLFLQAVAIRMKQQLRSRDTLARLGGDEFAALVPVARNLADVEEIALRLERCFDQAFVIEGHILQGAASVGIALYPQNGSTKDELLHAADTAMYEAKNAKRQIARMMTGEKNSLSQPIPSANLPTR